MMYIVLTPAHPGQLEREKQWHVGERSPVQPEDAKNVIEVQADGHELQYLYNAFRGLPRPDIIKRSVRFFGDWAKFIAANL